MAISPPRPKGPPLNALRAFDAAARHCSFTRAANELCVTPGAVAQQVKSLESWSGAQLFTRKAHGIALTELGQALLPDFVDAFDRLGAAVQKLRSRANPDQVRIAALPSVAQLWLSPRLPKIRCTHGAPEISVIATETPPNLNRELIDLSIFFEDLPGDPNHIEICRDTIFPVCTPALAQKLRKTVDLERVTCLTDTQWNNDWNRWLDKTIPGHTVTTSGPSYSLYSLMLEEAQNGAGVMMAHESLVQAQLRSGSLIAPFATRVELDRRLAIACAFPPQPGTLIDDIIQSLASPDSAPA